VNWHIHLSRDEIALIEYHNIDTRPHFSIGRFRYLLMCHFEQSPSKLNLQTTAAKQALRCFCPPEIHESRKMNETTLNPRLLKKKRPSRLRELVQNTIAPLMWLAFMLYGLLMFGGIAIGLLVLALTQGNLNGFTLLIMFMGLVCSVLTWIVLREIYTTLRQFYRRRCAAIGFRREHERIARLLEAKQHG
jgi:hypothetical protein